jgi:hypothetical protein
METRRDTGMRSLRWVPVAVVAGGGQIALSRGGGNPAPALARFVLRSSSGTVNGRRIEAV